MKTFGKITAFLGREKLYVILLIFVISANFSLSLLANVFETAEPPTVFDKEAPSDGNMVFDQKVAGAIASNPGTYAAFRLLSWLFLLFSAAGIIIDAVFLYKSAADRNPIAATQAVGRADWGLFDICKVIIIFFFAESVVSLGGVCTALFLPDLPIDRNLRMMLISTLLDIVAVAAVFYFALWKTRQGFASLGLTAKRVFLNIKYGMTAYAGLLPIFLAVTLLTSVLFRVLDIPIEPQEVIEILKKEKGTASLAYMCVFASVLGPVMEEIFFRGFVYGALRRKVGVFGGILASAAFFAYVHANMASFMPIFSLGILLAYIYEKTGSLVSSATVHVIHNSSMLAVVLFLKAAAG